MRKKVFQGPRQSRLYKVSNRSTRECLAQKMVQLSHIDCHKGLPIGTQRETEAVRTKNTRNEEYVPKRDVC